MSSIATFFPTGYCYELKGLIILAWPIILTLILQTSLQPIAIMFCGHLGKTELDAVALANSLIGISGTSIACGLATACDTLYSQTFGSNNKYKLGICLQRALFIVTLAIFPCWAIHLNIETILLLIGQDIEVSRLTARYMLIFMPGLLAFFIYEPLSKYMQNQNVVLPTMVIALIPNIITVVLHYIFVIVCKMGTDGSAIAQAISYLSFLPIAMAYIYFSKMYKKTWNGWSIECLQHWGQFYSLAIAGLIMVTIEWWTFEVGTILSGLLGTTELGAQSVIMYIEQFSYMPAYGLGIATSIRIGHNLGSGSALGAKTVVRTSFTVISVLAAFVGILLATLANYLPYIFTNVPEVIKLTASVLPVLGLYMIFDGVSGVSTGILRGSGRQRLGVGVVTIAFCLIGLPIGISLMLYTSLGVLGWWLGLAAGLFTAAVIYVVVICLTNWDNQVELAETRIRSYKNTVRTDEVNEKSALLKDNTEEAVKNNTAAKENVQEMLSRSKLARLLLLRLLTLVFMFGILLVGILCRIYIPVDEIRRRTINNTNANDTTLE